MKVPAWAIAIIPLFLVALAGCGRAVPSPPTPTPVAPPPPTPTPASTNKPIAISLSLTDPAAPNENERFKQRIRLTVGEKELKYVTIRLTLPDRLQLVDPGSKKPERVNGNTFLWDYKEQEMAAGHIEDLILTLQGSGMISARDIAVAEGYVKVNDKDEKILAFNVPPNWEHGLRPIDMKDRHKVGEDFKVELYIQTIPPRNMLAKIEIIFPEGVEAGPLQESTDGIQPSKQGRNLVFEDVTVKGRFAASIIVKPSAAGTYQITALFQNKAWEAKDKNETSVKIWE